MEILQGPIICHPTVYTKHIGSFFPSVINSVTKVKLVKSQNMGYKRFIRIKPLQQSKRGSGVVHCSISSSSDDSGSTAENFRVNDEEYVNSSVIEAVEVRSGSDGFVIKMRDGELLRCIHNNPLSGNPLDYAPHPAIVLKMEDGSDLLLPIIVLEMPSVLLMATLRNVQIARPTIYQVVEEMIDKMGYEVQLVRVTKRVHEAYFAQLYLVKDGDETERISFDLRPSDAINIATRCKVPIQVNKQLVFTDGMRVVEQNKHMFHHSMTDGLLFTELDKPNGQSCIEAKEFCLVRNMYVAAVEERYGDAVDHGFMRDLDNYTLSNSSPLGWRLVHNK